MENFKKLIGLSVFFLSFTGFGQKISVPSNPNAAYQAPAFSDGARLQKLETLFPLVEKIYKEYAEKIIFPATPLG
jgi:hypothetical protein